MSSGGNVASGLSSRVIYKPVSYSQVFLLNDFCFFLKLSKSFDPEFSILCNIFQKVKPFTNYVFKSSPVLSETRKAKCT